MSQARYIPKLETIAQAARQLPEAGSWREDIYRVPLQDKHLLEFRRVKFKGSLGRSVHKWIYDGKIRVN